ncbi:hypothetical protein PQE74_gp229 [Bacillus phage vB_BanS_Chewbecca]|uniref:Uncharacterized protein n=4 Tax=Caudoviricetes TaxID=2731619 RepID=A0AAE8YYD3_9CAUD|nr:hypothetical protein PQE72_gp021 [Bacillus phage vB_BanS_Skywalker]YP_010681123.1 hypothetical protein PQE73_gp240 [Bacillus phage vB_BanS_MrDarsey]YP_010681361.1 hypothetical protein PQE74_gp229 [Bacillus phage vB_BanS_Chewbecca]UGO46301.1 hypothetical protein CHEWBECCA_238 [Bacillus phage vB_BanS_Chewbecca]UGO48059.1 hypothetical protein MRDARSEY_247 [Bacillus phage vB_BanS_MrDarsey]UGO51199.1 hypothetical protein SKYWALKER_21 [Bacillus phage vB_BanS_Skywalker]
MRDEEILIYKVKVKDDDVKIVNLKKYPPRCKWLRKNFEKDFKKQ